MVSSKCQSQKDADLGQVAYFSQITQFRSSGDQKSHPVNNKPWSTIDQRACQLMENSKSPQLRGLPRSQAHS